MFWPRGIWAGLASTPELSESVASYQTAHDGAEVENGPKPSKVAALFLLIGIRKHDSALCGPEKTGAQTKEDTSEDTEASNRLVNGNEQADGVDAVADAAERQRPLDTEPVDEATTEETKDGKSGVEGRVLMTISDNVQDPAVMGEHLSYHVVSQLRRRLATTTQTTQSVEHARAHEAHKRYHDELDLRRGVPDLGAKQRLVLPAGRAVDGAIIGVMVQRLVARDGLAGGMLGLGVRHFSGKSRHGK